ncbi:hypothetical protein Ciccas_014229, partial [Cichlidogyrus casuarinus]
LWFCPRCGKKLCPSDLVFDVSGQARFHECCFSCCDCKKPLRSGDRYVFFQREVFCQEHLTKELKMPSKTVSDSAKRKPKSKKPVKPANADVSADAKLLSTDSTYQPKIHPDGYCLEPLGESTRLSLLLSPDDGHMAKMESTTLLPLCDENQCVEEDEEAQRTGSKCAEISSKSGRQKRIRTSFKHQQLRIMKSFFDSNHNPDAKDLRLLSQRTGLPKRVLQVWFQNARAKFRRSFTGTLNGLVRVLREKDI